MSVRYSDKLVVGESGVPITTGALTIYVDAAGSDVTGDGSAGSPYATVEKADQDIPEIIRHECKILVAAGNYASGWPESLDHSYKDSGSLAIVGVGTPTVVTGPWTVTGVADLGTGGQRVTVGAGGLGTDDSLCGQTMMIATGGHPDYGYQVVANTDTTIDVILVTDKVVNADTFNLVVPAVKIASDGLHIKHDSLGVGAAPGENGRFIIHNIWIDLLAAPVYTNNVQIHGTQARDGILLSFMRIDTQAASYSTVTLYDCIINGLSEPISTAYITDGGTGITNLGGSSKVGATISGDGDRASLAIRIFGRVQLSSMAIKGQIAAELAQCSLSNVGMGLFASGISSTTRIGYCVIVGKAGEYGVEISEGNLHLDESYFVQGSSAVSVSSCTRAYIGATECDPVGITGSGMEIGAGCTVHQDGALANFIGASASGAKAYTFDCAAVKADTWMAANFNDATDAKGATLIRQD